MEKKAIVDTALMFNGITYKRGDIVHITWDIGRAGVRESTGRISDITIYRIILDTSRLYEAGEERIGVSQIESITLV